MGTNAGTGPGEITPDGCAVEFYALLPAMGEAPIVHAAVPAGASILELGCGTGRILRALAELGHPVLGVDESAAMLDRAAGLPTVCSPIETLRLDRTFGAVLLASTMINTNPAQRRAFLAACGRHAGTGGVVVIQQTAPAWFGDGEPSQAGGRGHPAGRQVGAPDRAVRGRGRGVPRRRPDLDARLPAAPDQRAGTRGGPRVGRPGVRPVAHR